MNGENGAIEINLPYVVYFKEKPLALGMYHVSSGPEVQDWCLLMVFNCEILYSSIDCKMSHGSLELAEMA